MEPGDRKSLYPKVEEANPDLNSPFLSSPNDPARAALYPSLRDPPPKTSPPSNNLYPSVEISDLVENLFPDEDSNVLAPENSYLGPPPVEVLILLIPGAILHLIDRERSVELGTGDFSVVQLQQGENVIAVFARVGNDVQWPLAKDEISARLDISRYFFSLRTPEGFQDAGEEQRSDDFLHYGLTFASKGQESLLETLDGILNHYTSFSVQKVETKSEILDASLAKETSPAEVASEGPTKEKIEKLSAAYWTTLAPNVEDYSGALPRAIARGSGQIIKGILWCGDVTVDGLNRGNQVLKTRMSPNPKPSEISEQALRRMKR